MRGGMKGSMQFVTYIIEFAPIYFVTHMYCGMTGSVDEPSGTACKKAAQEGKGARMQYINDDDWVCVNEFVSHVPYINDNGWVCVNESWPTYE